MNYLEVVEEILRQHCGVAGPIAPESRLQEDLGLESVGLLTLMVELENRLQRRLQEDPSAPPRTVAELARFVQEQVGD